MKCILVIFLSLVSMTTIVMADEKEDSLNYYVQRLTAAYESGDNHDACLSFKNALRLYKELAGDVSQDTVFASLEGEYGDLCFDLGDYESSLSALSEASEIYKTVAGEMHPFCGYSTGMIMYCYKQLGNYHEAQKQCEQVLRLHKEAEGNISSDEYYAFLKREYGTLCIETGNFDKAVEALTESSNIIKNIYGDSHPSYAVTLNNLAVCYMNLPNLDEAVRLITIVLEIYEESYGKEDFNYITSLMNLADCYYQMEDYKQAIKTGREAKELFLDSNQEDQSVYINISDHLLSSYYHNGNYKEALELGEEILQIKEQVFGKDDSQYASTLSEMASCYFYLGDYNNAIRLATEALEIREQVFGKEDPEYAVSLNNLANYYADLGDNNKAIQLGTEALEIRKKAFGEHNIEYATSLANLGNYYDNLGNYEKAFQLRTEALEINRAILGDDHPECAHLLINLANSYATIGFYEEATSYGSKAIEIYKNSFGTGHPFYALALRNQAFYYMGLENYKEAVRLGTEALGIYKEIFGEAHPGFAGALLNLAVCEYELGNYNEAIKLVTDSKEIYRNKLGTKSPEYTKCLLNLAKSFYSINKYDEAISSFNDYMEIVRDITLTNFLEMTTYERLMYWSQYKSAINELIPSFLIHMNLPKASMILYDYTALFAKGLLLSTELEMAKLIQENGNEEALQMYSKLRENRQFLNALYSKPITERGVDCDSLENISSNLERQLVSRVKEFGDYTRNLSITWCDVQNKLGDNDIAIEFLSYQENDSTTAYAALTLCKNDSSPILTHLFTDTDLLFASGDDGTYQTFKADSLVWTPLSSRLDGKSHVYFSASGMLHNIGIEYLPSMEGKECYRLSSTRELVTHQPSQAIGSATLFGDIDYDATYASIESSAPSSSSDYAMNTTSDQYRGRFDYRSMRYGVSPLPGTREEIKEVFALLKPLGKPCDALTGTQASEESFKKLSGQRKSLLHISTHGFYYTDEEASNLNDHLQMMLIGDNGPTNYEDQSLLRCGLCFAGANQTLSGESQPAAGQGDGILNALEIAQTDLRDLDLVVLSACQTALGDIAQGEGVFGLQRGFKKAGAQSILMSLWEVDDEITQMFMTEFYRAWTSGQTKTAALKTAQSIIKAKYPDPHHWAAFILLDALE